MAGCANKRPKLSLAPKAECPDPQLLPNLCTSPEAAPGVSAEDNDPHVQEHADLIEHPRGENQTELNSVAESSLTAIMGRMSAYTGKAVTCGAALKIEELMPDKHVRGRMPTPSASGYRQHQLIKE